MLMNDPARYEVLTDAAAQTRTDCKATVEFLDSNRNKFSIEEVAAVLATSVDVAIAAMGSRYDLDYYGRNSKWRRRTIYHNLAEIAALYPQWFPPEVTAAIRSHPTIRKIRVRTRLNKRQPTTERVLEPGDGGGKLLKFRPREIS